MVDSALTPVAITLGVLPNESCVMLLSFCGCVSGGGDDEEEDKEEEEDDDDRDRDCDCNGDGCGWFFESLTLPRSCDSTDWAAVAEADELINAQAFKRALKELLEPVD